MNDTTAIATDPQADDVRAYVGAVRAWLGDLPPEEVEDLTAGMEADLAERAAESGDTLGALLGEPEAYAAELRSAAGLPPRWVPVAAAAPGPRRAEVPARLDPGDGRRRRAPLPVAARPAPVLVAGPRRRGRLGGAVGARHVELVPAARGGRVSFWIGRRTAAGRMPSWSRGLLVAGNALAIVLLLPATGSLLSSGGDDGETGPAYAPAGLSRTGSRCRTSTPTTRRATASRTCACSTSTASRCRSGPVPSSAPRSRRPGHRRLADGRALAGRVPAPALRGRRPVGRRGRGVGAARAHRAAQPARPSRPRARARARRHPRRPARRDLEPDTLVVGQPRHRARAARRSKDIGHLGDEQRGAGPRHTVASPPWPNWQRQAT